MRSVRTALILLWVVEILGDRGMNYCERDSSLDRRTHYRGFGEEEVSGVNFRIIGGRDAKKGEFPFMVSLQIVYTKGNFPLCGAAIISKNFILTAGHCLKDAANYRFEAVAGELTLKEDDGTEQLVHVVEHWLHPNYTTKSFKERTDAAVAKVEPSFVFNKHVQPIALPPTDVYPFGDALLCGWGYDGKNKGPHRTLKAVTLDLLTRKDCVRFTRNVDYFCTGPLEGGKGGCGGDSGGPLVQWSNDTGAYEIVGLTSYLVGACGQRGLPTIYQGVSPIVNWVKELMHE